MRKSNQFRVRFVTLHWLPAVLFGVLMLCVSCEKEDSGDVCQEEMKAAECVGNIVLAAQWEYEKCKAMSDCPKEREEALCKFFAEMDSYHLILLSKYVQCLPDGRPDKIQWQQTFDIKLALHVEIPCASEVIGAMSIPDADDFPEEVRENIKRGREMGSYPYPCLPVF